MAGMKSKRLPLRHGEQIAHHVINHPLAHANPGIGNRAVEQTGDDVSANEAIAMQASNSPLPDKYDIQPGAGWLSST